LNHFGGQGLGLTGGDRWRPADEKVAAGEAGD
jgi:hypothetical protein